MNHRFSLNIAAERDNLAEIRRFVEESTATLGLEPAAIPDVGLAVDEAVTNIIVHGYQNRQGNLEIEIGREGNSLVIRLRDEATPFDLDSISPPDLTAPLEERSSGGMGVYLIRQIMDEAIYRVIPGGGNELTLVKRGLGHKP